MTRHMVTYTHVLGDKVNPYVEILTAVPFGTAKNAVTITKTRVDLKSGAVETGYERVLFPSSEHVNEFLDAINATGPTYRVMPSWYADNGGSRIDKW